MGKVIHISREKIRFCKKSNTWYYYNNNGTRILSYRIRSFLICESSKEEFICKKFAS